MTPNSRVIGAERLGPLCLLTLQRSLGAVALSLKKAGLKHTRVQSLIVSKQAQELPSAGVHENLTNTEASIVLC